MKKERMEGKYKPYYAAQMNREAGALEDVSKSLWVGEEVGKMSQTGAMESVGSFPLVSPINLSSYSGCTSW